MICMRRFTLNYKFTFSVSQSFAHKDKDLLHHRENHPWHTGYKNYFFTFVIAKVRTKLSSPKTNLTNMPSILAILTVLLGEILNLHRVHEIFADSGTHEQHQSCHFHNI